MNIIKDYRSTICFDTFTTLMKSEDPIWIGRYGGTDKFFFDPKKRETESELEMSTFCKFCGFYYKNNKKLNEVIEKSTDIYKKSLKNCDLTTVGNINTITDIISNHNRDDDGNPIHDEILFNNKPLCAFNLIEDPYIFFKSFRIWGENKKILIISPFSETIKYQTRKDRINNLFKEEERDSFIFPNCEFVTYQTPITYNDNSGINSNYFNNVTEKYDNWIEHLEDMKKDIEKIDFDIAFISCGVYAMPLGDFIKNIGKKSIYVGGILNMFFNIYGERYKGDSPNIHNLEYQVDCMDKFDDLFDKKSNMFIANSESISAYFRYYKK